MTVSEEKAGIEHLKPIEQAAILLLSVGESNAASIMRHLTPKELQKVGAQMANMSDVKSADVALVMEQVLVEAGSATGLGVGTETYIRNVLIEALGEERATTVIDHILMSDKTKGLEGLRWMNPKLVANTIRGEHPQIQAVILSISTPTRRPRCSRSSRKRPAPTC